MGEVNHGCLRLLLLGTKNFAGVELGDKRRTNRLIASAARIAEHPEKSFNQIFDWNELRAFYLLCHQERATLQAVQATHWQLTRQEMAKQPLALILHDTSELDYTDHIALQDIGPIGDGNGRGFLQHNSLAVLPDPRQVLGLAYQQLYIRKPAPKKEHTSKRKHRERESQLWMRGIEATGRPPQGCRWVDVGDRGADIYEAMVAAQALGHDFVFRLTQNRQVWTTPEAEEFTKLRDHARGLASQGRGSVDIPGRGGRAARLAEVEMAAAPVWIPAPSGTPQRASQPTIAAWVVRVWEAQPPPGVQALEWILITSVPTETFEHLQERRQWYACRWMIEVFHDIEKNGCAEEKRRFEKAERMEACLAILSVVAVRIFQLRTALDSQPDAPAEQVATRAEIEVLRRVVTRPVVKKRGVVLTVRDFVRGVAGLGGFLGRKGDGNPGVKTLWRGYQRLQDLLLGYQLRRLPSGREVGNR
jgi:Transposase DNA-binding/Transposase Tn5 dimerisation domain